MTDGLTQAVTAVSLPRWLEVRDRTPGHDRYAPGRVRHYVISPSLSVSEAQPFAEALDRRAALERAAQRHRDLSGPMLVAAGVLVGGVVLAQLPLWLTLVVILPTALLYRLGSEATVTADLPVDLDAIEECAGVTLFYSIAPVEYYQATRTSKRSEEYAKAVHQAMWRAYELRALAFSVKEEFEILSSELTLKTKEAEVSRERVNAMIKAAQEAHEELATMLDFRQRTRTQTLQQLTDLSGRIDSALAQYGAGDAPQPDQKPEQEPDV